MALQPSVIRQPTRRGILRVEGPDDKGILVAALQYLGAGRRVDVRDSGGIDELLAVIPTELKGSDLGQLGIVADADSDAHACWDRIRGVLSAFGYHGLPKHPRGGGLVARPTNLPAIGIWIMPDNARPGAIEHFARMLVPSSDLLWTKANSVIEEVSLIDRRFGSNELKATMHSWLAWQAEPGRPMGQAITKRFLDPASPATDDLYRWLRALFEL